MSTLLNPFRAAAVMTTIFMFAAAPAVAQDKFPSKPIRIVVNFAAGGPTDTIARAVADKMAASLGQSVIVDNRPGAGGNLGAAEVAKAEPDGYTILAGIDTTFTVNPALYKSMPFAIDSLKPLMIMASSGLLVAANPAVGVKTLAELAARAKKEPMNFSSGGNGSPGHLAAEIFSEATGAKITQVPYKGNAPAALAILSGEVQAGILATPGLVQHAKSGKVIPLAVTSSKRSTVLPDVPTTAEAGMKDLLVEVLQVAMVPAATPAPVVEALRRAMAAALDDPAVRTQLTQQDSIIEKQSGPAAEERLAAARTRYARIVKATGMKAE